MKDLEQEIVKLRRWEDAYYNGTPLVPDATYDVERDSLVDRIEKEQPSHPYLDEVGSPAPSGGQWDKFTHSTVMGSLFKVKTEAELRKWAQGKGEEFFLSEKADGCTIVGYYEEGKLAALATRGDGLVGEDITAIARYFQNVRLKLPNEFTGVLRGEGILFLDAFQEHFASLGTANPRNGASGKARDTKNPHLKRHIVVKWFDVIGDEDFQTWEDKFAFIESLGLETIARYPNLSLEDAWKIYENYVNGRRESLNYWIDGLVIRVSDLEAHDAFGVTDKRPKGSRAIKFPAVGVETTLEKAETGTRGRGGRFAPVGIIDPVLIDGTTVTRVSMHGPDWIEAMDVAIGDTVLVAKAGDIIPQIIQVIGRPNNRRAITFPTQCPLCEIALVRNGAYIECQNKSCEGETAGALGKWLEKTGIKGIGDSILQELINEVRDVADLYEADSDVFARAARGSEKLGKKIFLAVQKTRELPLAVFLSGLHVDSLGTTNGQRVASHFKDLRSVMEASEEEFRKIEGISENAAKIAAGLLRKKDLIERLDQLLQIKEVTQGALSGSSFCITGKMKSGRKRKELEAWVKERGGLMKSGVDKNLTYLVTDTPESSSSKNKKADKYGVNKITEEQLYELLPGEPEKVTSLKQATNRVVVKQGSGSSLFEVASDSDGWIDLSEDNGKFSIVSSSLLEQGDPMQKKTRLGFLSWGNFRDIDDGASPQSQKLKISSFLKKNDIELRETVMVAPSIEDLEKALSQVTFIAWSEGDL